MSQIESLNGNTKGKEEEVSSLIKSQNSFHQSFVQLLGSARDNKTLVESVHIETVQVRLLGAQNDALKMILMLRVRFVLPSSLLCCCLNSIRPKNGITKRSNLVHNLILIRI